jgi:hypothetical protein
MPIVADRINRGFVAEPATRLSSDDVKIRELNTDRCAFVNDDFKRRLRSYVTPVGAMRQNACGSIWGWTTQFMPCDGNGLFEYRHQMAVGNSGEPERLNVQTF